MACNPATPAPSTNTRAGARVPAAVMSMGNMRGSVLAASSTALYPAMVAMEESTSMLCARVIRGISSMASSVTPCAASAAASRRAVSGSANPMTICPRRNRGRSAAPASGFAPRVRTCASTSAAANTSARVAATRAPFSWYSASENPAAAPAPVSTTNSTPLLASISMARGTIATRRSPGNVSLGTPITTDKFPSSALRAVLTVAHGVAADRGRNVRKITVPLPHPAGFLTHHRLSPGAAERTAELRHVRHHPVDAPAPRRVRVRQCQPPRVFVRLVAAPHLPPAEEEALRGGEAVDLRRRFARQRRKQRHVGEAHPARVGRVFPQRELAVQLRIRDGTPARRRRSTSR